MKITENVHLIRKEFQVKLIAIIVFGIILAFVVHKFNRVDTFIKGFGCTGQQILYMSLYRYEGISDYEK